MKQFAVLLSLFAACADALAASPADVAGTAYYADVPFPQFLPLWSEGWALKDQNGEPLQYATTNMPLGAYVQLYLHNRSANAVPISDVKFEGTSLNDAIAFSDQETSGLWPASIHFSKLPRADLDRLIAGGEPVWWKVVPPTLPPGGFAEVTIRLRRHPSTPLTVQVRANETTWIAQVAPTNTPRFTSISFKSSLDTVYCYVEHPRGLGAIPVKILLDGEDFTARTTMAADRAVGVAPLVIRLARPLAKGSFHCFQAICDDGSSAIAGIRAWGEELVYGMWGYINQGKTPQERVDYYLNDLKGHNVNAVMESYGGEVGEFLSG